MDEDFSDSNSGKRGNGLKSFVGLIVLLIILLASQQAFFRPYGLNAYKQAGPAVGEYKQKAGLWFSAAVAPKISRGVSDGGEIAKQEITKQKNNFFKGVWWGIKNYLAEKFSKVSGTKVE